MQGKGKAWTVAVTALVGTVLLLQVAARPATADVTPLAAGCNQVVSTFADDTPVATVAAAVTPATALRSLWRLERASGRLVGYTPDPRVPVDLRVVNRHDVLWVCVTAPAQLQQPDLNVAGATLRCSARALPVGRAENVWSVACTLSSAPVTDRNFAVRAFAPDGQWVCEGELHSGAGTCGGSLRVGLDVGLPGALAFYARTSPSGTTATDRSPEEGRLRGP